MDKLILKITSIFKRVWITVVSVPKHTLRLWKHLSYFVPGMSYQLPCKPPNLAIGIGETILYLFDIVGVPALYETVWDLLKWSTRPLTNNELELAKTYYQETIDYNLVRVHPKARFTAVKFALAYVSFNTINHYKPLSRDVFVHELMHIWQYQNLGSVYAIKALYAQYKGNAYDYGGFEGLYHAMLQNRDLLSFNFEQQAEIIQDYCRLSEINALSPMANTVYQFYVRQLNL